jgi:hypothetical protein
MWANSAIKIAKVKKRKFAQSGHPEEQTFISQAFIKV